MSRHRRQSKYPIAAIAHAMQFVALPFAAEIARAHGGAIGVVSTVREHAFVRMPADQAGCAAQALADRK